MSAPAVGMTDEHVKTVCRPGCGNATCRYLTMGAEGWGCAKLDGRLRFHIDNRVAAGTMGARGDNCEGLAP
jgi:hypothetical protein